MVMAVMAPPCVFLPWLPLSPTNDPKTQPLGGHLDDFGKTHLIAQNHIVTYYRVLQGVDAALHYKPINSAKYISGKIYQQWACSIRTLAQTCANLEGKPLIYCLAIRWNSLKIVISQTLQISQTVVDSEAFILSYMSSSSHDLWVAE